MTSLTVVMGMHRSGTSLCAHALQVLGLDMADERGEGTGNPDGHWERFPLAACHDRILRLYGADYMGPQHHRALPPAWWAEPETRAIKRDIEAFLRAEVLPRPRPGFKDPRVARLMHLWDEIADDLALHLRFVLCLRHPAQIARSLVARDGMQPEVAEYLWLQYNAAALVGLGRRFDVCFIDFDDWFDDPSHNARKLGQFVGLSDVRIDQLLPALRRVVDAGQRHGQGGLIRLSAATMLWMDLAEATAQGNIVTPHLVDHARWLAASLDAAGAVIGALAPQRSAA